MMEKFKRKIDIDISKFESDSEILKTKYGLPGEIKFCKKCVISNQRPNSCVEYEHTKESKRDNQF